MSSNHNEWNTIDWLVDARRLVHWINNGSVRHPAMLVIRHSHRESTKDVQILREMHLTELGHRMANQFGERLQKHRDIEIYYSSHPRCYETAQDIVDRYNETGGQAKLISDLRVLLGPKGSGGSISGEMM
ncbi:MAG: histidine phosphatase family protein, partial [Candidatus Thorarchaeota archaeon]